MTIDAQSVAVLLPTETGELRNGSVTFDESWSPFVQGRVSIKTPTDLASLDNRNGSPRVTITVTQTFADADPTSALTALWGGKVTSQITAAWGGLVTSALTALYSRPYNPSEVHPEIQRTMSLLIRSYTRDHDGTVSLDLSTDEALLQEWVAVSNYTPTGTTIRDVINEALTIALGAGIALESSTANLPINPADYRWERNVTAWDYVASIAQGAGMRIWCTELRVWRLEFDPSPALGTITLDKPVSWSESITRDGDWFNGVGYTYPDPLGTITNYVYTTPHTPLKMLLVNNDTPPVQSGLAAATALLERASKKGKLIILRTVNDWAALVSMNAKVTIDPPTEITRRLTAVTFDLGGSFEMTATTKEI